MVREDDAKHSDWYTAGKHDVLCVTTYTDLSVCPLMGTSTLDSTAHLELMILLNCFTSCSWSLGRQAQWVWLLLSGRVGAGALLLHAEAAKNKQIIWKAAIDITVQVRGKLQPIAVWWWWWEMKIMKKTRLILFAGYGV